MKSYNILCLTYCEFVRNFFPQFLISFTQQPNVALPSYDEESIPLFPDSRPKGLPNLAESKLESTQPLAEGPQAQNTS